MKRGIESYFTTSKKLLKPNEGTAAKPEQSSVESPASSYEDKARSVGTSEAHPCTEAISPFDIGHVIDSPITDDQQRIKFLDNVWCPSNNFKWPFSERKDGSKLRKKFLGRQHITGEYDCFAYSNLKKGLFCKFCVVLAPLEVRGVKLNRLVKTPLQKYAHLTGKDGYLTNHLRTKTSMQNA